MGAVWPRVYTTDALDLAAHLAITSERYGDGQQVPSHRTTKRLFRRPAECCKCRHSPTPPGSIPKFQNPPGAVSSAKKESIAYTSSRGRFDRLAEHFDLSRVSWADLHKSHRVLPRGTSIWNAPVASSCIMHQASGLRGKACKEWNPGCRVQIFCRSTLLLLFQVSTTRTTVGERRQQVTKEDETCTRRWSNSRHQTW